MQEEQIFLNLNFNQIKTDLVTSDSGTSEYQGCVNALSNIALMS